MIFATVGTQLPFDRLLSGLDAWAGRNPGVPVFAQAGATRGRFAHLETADFLTQDAFRARFDAARLVVAHAGMGAILAAAETGKPILVMPRSAALGEHRTDHQHDTACEMSSLSNVTVVEDVEALAAALDAALARGFALPEAVTGAGAAASRQLLASLRDFVWSEPVGTRTRRVRWLERVLP